MNRFGDVLRVIYLFNVMSAESPNLSCYELRNYEVAFCNLVTIIDNR